ncbi:phenylalanine--tRNA ligase subunit alpha [Anaplasma bovis]|uniref:phenylalanine--tRNA ligase subunit alpha n=1 Tax=Anaplasma bovis TaxID=186733 RepID=UPI002FEEDC97
MQQLLSRIRDLGSEASVSVDSCSSIEELEAVRSKYLGKSGSLVSLLRGLSGIPNVDERKHVGELLNSVCSSLKATINDKRASFSRAAMYERLAKERLDVTLPARMRVRGKMHPISRVIAEIRVILSSLGFSFTDGPDIEDEFHVFDALNTPAHHPARDKNDTFYLAKSLNGKRMLLRTHTSSVQIRVMEGGSLSFPIKIFSVGKVYRNDWDATHSPMFHQAEGLFVDEGVNMGHLKYSIDCIVRRLFGNAVEYRTRASFFPFTEPSLEIDIKNEHGKWVEILGCGMVHHRVLENVNIDYERYSGFAFGIGIERVAMLKYGISDLRSLYGNQPAWLEHYGFCFTDIIDIAR